VSGGSGVPVLGLIFLRYADHKFSHAEKELANKGSQRRFVSKADYQARGVMYLPPTARLARFQVNGGFRR
jgi:type I restriction enzyme M protein